ncbi:cystathionine beta-lyase [Pollutimonas bauzanensis]|uniref:Cystathionine beta-lyase n=1 Tax=Pollutimonas bauzanensis TaxID=658167 RepID=A0A1M5NK63_9BURK|nr:cystathionine beta-lyase [Pollutimonas bauzanensis]SHG89333.1 cystathionine beta-lyase [Pollutimonas bauzanensis]
MNHHYDTRLLQAGKPDFFQGTAPVNVPVVRTSTVRYQSTQVQRELHERRDNGEEVASYGRHGTDTHRALEQAFNTLEGGHRTFLTPSGLSAIATTLLALLSPGEHALVADSVYSPLRRIEARLLERLNITLTYFSPARDDISTLARPNTRLLYLESPSSLLFEVLDLPALAAAGRALGLTVVADNTWGAGYLYHPLQLGAHVSVHAATKYIGGHSDLMMGAIVVADASRAESLALAYDTLGLAVSADDAYLALRGLRSLPVRLAQHGRNALAVARHLQAHAEVAKVFHPALPEDPGHALWRRDFSGANGLLSIEFSRFGAAAADAFINALTLFGIGASWGGYESLVLAAAPGRLAEHSYWQGTRPVVRLHIGLEDPDDLIADLDQALAAASRQEIDSWSQR